MPISFDERVEHAWTASDWIIDEMFNGGMCFFEAYIPLVNLDDLGATLPQLSNSEINCSCSVWANDTNESEWNRAYELAEYVSFFRAGRILMLNVNYDVAFAGFSFKLKLMFEPDGDLEVIFYRDNLLPRHETQPRFVAACHYFHHLQSLFQGAALFIGPDTLSYPAWPDSAPKEWQRLL